MTRIGRRLTQLAVAVNELQDQALIDARDLALERSATELCALTARVLGQLGSDLDVDRILLEARPPAVVRIDAPRIARVIASLVRNAIIAVPRSSPIVVRIEKRGGAARISVVDEGPGLLDAQLHHVFDRPLGLSVARAVVRAHGGELRVASTCGKGTRYWFELPLAG